MDRRWDDVTSAPESLWACRLTYLVPGGEGRGHRVPFCLKMVSGGRLLEGASLVSTGHPLVSGWVFCE